MTTKDKLTLTYTPAQPSHSLLCTREEVFCQNQSYFPANWWLLYISQEKVWWSGENCVDVRKIVFLWEIIACSSECRLGGSLCPSTSEARVRPVRCSSHIIQPIGGQFCTQLTNQKGVSNLIVDPFIQICGGSTEKMSRGLCNTRIFQLCLENVKPEN